MLLWSCRPEELRFEDNPIPYYDGISTVVLDAYITRAYIDLIGREPLVEEIEVERAALRAGNLSQESRLNMVDRLMGGDIALLPAYERKLTGDLNGRFLDGASLESMLEEVQLRRDMATQDSLQGNMTGYLHQSDLADRMENAVKAVEDMRLGTATWREVCKRYCYNTFYDDLNMNSFNFIHAAFDDLMGRNPTEAEFEQAYAAVEYASPAMLFGTAISNKVEFLYAMVGDVEFDEGAIRWWGEYLLVRPISTAEVSAWKTAVGADVDIRALQRLLIAGDEYADFE